MDVVSYTHSVNTQMFGIYEISALSRFFFTPCWYVVSFTQAVKTVGFSIDTPGSSHHTAKTSMASSEYTPLGGFEPKTTKNRLLETTRFLDHNTKVRKLKHQKFRLHTVVWFSRLAKNPVLNSTNRP